MSVCPRCNILDRDRAFMQRKAREQQIHQMTSEEIDEVVVKTIIDAVTRTGTIADADFKRASIPPGSLTKSRFTRCLDLARERDPAVATAECIA